MSSKEPKRYLTVLDVGHGSAAVLRDEGGVVVFDTGRGAYVSRFLEGLNVHCIDDLFLSHADIDHIGGAVTLLLNHSVRIGRVALNPDPSKETDVFRQLCVALCDAEKRCGTRIEPSLTTSTVTTRKGAAIEILYPAAATALAGVGGKTPNGERYTSNSLSAAIRVTGGPFASVLLGGDIEFDCVEEWKKQNVNAAATVLVFPHHGGLSGKGNESNTEQFAHEIAKLVTPSMVVFSIHRTRHGNPRAEVLTAVAKASKDVRFACTQLPDRFHALVGKSGPWCLHHDPTGKCILEGTMEFELLQEEVKIKFIGSEWQKAE